MKRVVHALLVGALTVGLQGCGFLVVQGARYAYGLYQSQEKAVRATLEQYRARILQLDPQGTGVLLDEHIQWSHAAWAPLVGREGVQRFLHSLAGFEVTAYALEATTTQVLDHQARQQGAYRITVLTPWGETIASRGLFEARWSRLADGPWLLAEWHSWEAATPSTSARAAALGVLE